MDKTKPFCISKHVVWEAYLRVKANKGAAGIDDESLTDFEEDLKNNLYKIWNRMLSGTRLPAASSHGFDTESSGRPKEARDSHCGGPGSADGR